MYFPDDRPYHRTRRAWNRAIDVYPALIARCANTQEVVRAVEFARHHDLLSASALAVTVLGDMASAKAPR
jgi:hypothetical protein